CRAGAARRHARARRRPRRTQGDRGRVAEGRTAVGRRFRPRRAVQRAGLSRDLDGGRRAQRGRQGGRDRPADRRIRRARLRALDRQHVLLPAGHRPAGRRPRAAGPARRGGHRLERDGAQPRAGDRRQPRGRQRAGRAGVLGDLPPEGVNAGRPTVRRRARQPAPCCSRCVAAGTGQPASAPTLAIASSVSNQTCQEWSLFVYGRTAIFGPSSVKSSSDTSGAGSVATFGTFATAAFSRAIASSGSTPLASCAMRSTRRTGNALKFWMLSENSLLLPTTVITLSGVTIVVPNRPISLTVPIVPPALMKSPTLNGRRISRKAPAAKCASSPPQATPIATPAPASIAAIEVVWMPK